MKRYEYIKDQAAFTTDWPDEEIYTPNAIENLRISLFGSASAATAKTMTDLMPVLTMLEVKHGGDPIIRLSMKELCAFSSLFMGRPIIGFDCDAVTGEDVMVLDQVLPLRVPAGRAPIYFNADYTAQTNIGTEKLTIIKEEIEEGPTGLPLRIMPFSYTPTATATELKALEWVNAGPLHAIMFYVPTAMRETVEATDLTHFILYIGGVLKSRTNIHNIYKPIRYYAQKNEAEVAKTLEGFFLWDFRPNPVPAGSALRLDIKAGATGNTKIWPIEDIPL